MTERNLSRRIFLGGTGAASMVVASGILAGGETINTWGRGTTEAVQLECDVLVAGGGLALFFATRHDTPPPVPAAVAKAPAPAQPVLRDGGR